MANLKGNEPMKKRIGLCLPDDLYMWLQRLALENRRSISDIIRYIIENAKENGYRP